VRLRVRTTVVQPQDTDARITYVMCLDTRSFQWFNDARRDLVHSARLLRRNPVLTITATLSLAIGIGANTTIFTVANALLLQPPAGVAEPSRLVDIGGSRGGVGFGPSSYPNYLDIRQRASTLDAVYAYSRFPEAISVGGAGRSTQNFDGPVHRRQHGFSV
jgi:hypothetical protein